MSFVPASLAYDNTAPDAEAERKEREAEEARAKQGTIQNRGEDIRLPPVPIPRTGKKPFVLDW